MKGGSAKDGHQITFTNVCVYIYIYVFVHIYIYTEMVVRCAFCATPQTASHHHRGERLSII